MIRFSCVAACLVLLGCGEKKAAAPLVPSAPKTVEKKPEPPKPPPLALEDREVEARNNLGDGLKLKTRVPVGWTGAGTTFRPPGDLGDRFISFEASCDGSCSAKDLPGNLAKYIAAAPDAATRPNFGTGNPQLDAVRLDVKVLEKGELPGGQFVAYQVSKPAGLDGPYQEGFRARCGRYRAGDPVFAVASVKAPLSDEKTLWPLLLEACKAMEATAVLPRR